MDHQISSSLTFFTVLLSLLWYIQPVVSANLTGDFVCTRLQTYEVQVTSLVRQPFLIRENVWCAKIPPRCVRTRTEYRLQVVTENVTKTRVVAECCPGYWPTDTSNCAPRCYGTFEGCGDHGQCVAPDVCKCQPGFHGAQCNQGYEFHQLPDWTTSPETTVSTPQYSSSYAPTTVRPTLSMIVPRQTTIMQIEISETTWTPSPSTSSSNTPAVTPTSSISPRILNEKEASDQIESSAAKTFETINNRTSSEMNSTEALSTLPPQVYSATESSTQVESISSTTQIEPSTINSSDRATDNYYETDKTKEKNSSDTTSVTKSDEESESISNSRFHQISTFSPQNFSISPKKVSISHIVVVSNNETSLSNNYFMHMDLMTTITVIIGCSCAVVLLSLLAVLLCHHRANRRKTAPMIVKSSGSESKSPSIRHSQVPLPPTPLDLNNVCHSHGGLLILHQHVTMATTNTFKPGSQQPTISPALREALEAHYDHPPSISMTMPRQRVSVDPVQRSPSVEALWDAVVNAACAAEQNDAPEHLYDEIPCWNPQMYANSPSTTLQTSRC